MEVEQETLSLENGEAPQEEEKLVMVKQQTEAEEVQVVVEEEEETANVLQFMDSMDAYLTLIHSLSSTLRQVKLFLMNLNIISKLIPSV